MKKIFNFFFAAFLGVLVLSACKDDDACYTCEATILGIENTQEFCDDGDDDFVVTSTVGGTSIDQTVTGDVEDYRDGLEAAGYDCSKD